MYNIILFVFLFCLVPTVIDYWVHFTLNIPGVIIDTISIVGDVFDGLNAAASISSGAMTIAMALHGCCGIQIGWSEATAMENAKNDANSKADFLLIVIY